MCPPLRVRRTQGASGGEERVGSPEGFIDPTVLVQEKYTLSLGESESIQVRLCLEAITGQLVHTCVALKNVCCPWCSDLSESVVIPSHLKRKREANRAERESLWKEETAPKTKGFTPSRKGKASVTPRTLQESAAPVDIAPELSPVK